MIIFIYDTDAQEKALHLCDESDDMTDTIKCRATAQYLCIWCHVYNYGYLGTNNSDENLTESQVTYQVE